MGLEDFATEDSLEQISDSEDDDLFEIEDEDLTDEPAAALPASDAADLSGSGGSGGDAEVAGATTVELMRSELDEVPELPSIPDESEYAPFDPELDEDLFQFDELFTAAESGAGDEFLSKVEMLAEQENAEVTESESDANEHQPATTAEQAPVLVSNSSDEIAPTADQTPPPTVTVASSSIFSSHLGRLLVAGFLIVNAAFVFFAWSASRSFKSAVEEAKTELAQSRQDAPTPLPTGPPPTSGSAPADLQAPAPERIDDWIASLDSPAEITFRIARREIEEGEYSAARRRLHLLLAARDSNGLDAEMAADAEYMIAEAWTNEARDASQKDTRQ